MTKFRQGHALRWNSSIAYGANFDDPVCKPTAELGGKDLGYVRVDDVWRYVIITTQTCDICEENKKHPRIPWITVAPVYDILPYIAKGQDNQIRANGFGYLVPLTHPQFLGDGVLWVADLRVEYPLEKSVLAIKDNDPIDVFGTEGDYNDFADKLALRRNRPAIDENVRKFITLPLRDSLLAGDIVHESILEMRIQCGPAWDHVETAQIVAVVKDRESVGRIADQFETWHGPISARLPNGLTLQTTAVVAYDDFTYDLSRRAVLIDFSEFSQN